MIHMLTNVLVVMMLVMAVLHFCLGMKALRRDVEDEIEERKQTNTLVIRSSFIQSAAMMLMAIALISDKYFE